MRASVRTPLVAALALVLALGVVASACSGDDADDSATPPSTGPRGPAGCQVRISGDLEQAFDAEDDADALESDHYYSQDELDALLGIDDVDNAAPVEADTGAEGEEGDLSGGTSTEGTAALTAWFLLNCQGQDITFSVFSNGASTPDDVPLAAGAFPVTSPVAFEDPRAFDAFILFGAASEPTTWAVDGDGGALVLERFDQFGAAGSLRVPMIEQTQAGEAGRQIVVEATFDVTCKEGENCSN